MADNEEWARAKLRLALSLMTQYQRDRYNKLIQKHALKRGLDHARQGGKMGRPKKFQGHTPGQGKATNEHSSLNDDRSLDVG